MGKPRVEFGKQTNLLVVALRSSSADIVINWDLSLDGRMLVMHTDYSFYIIVRDLCMQTFVEDLQD